MTPPPTALDLEALALAAAARPWRTGRKVGRTLYHVIEGSGGDDLLIGVLDNLYDAEWCAAARTAVPALVQRVRELEAENERAFQIVKKLVLDDTPLTESEIRYGIQVAERLAKAGAP